MSEVPQVVTRKGGMPAPRTRLQHLVDSKVLLKKKRRSNTTRLTSSGGGHGKCRSRELVSVRYRLPEPEGDSGLRYLLLATPCGDKQPIISRTMFSSAVKVTLTARTGHNNLPLQLILAFGRAGTEKPSTRGAREEGSLVLATKPVT